MHLWGLYPFIEIRNNWVDARDLFISPEGIINRFLSLVYKQAVYKCVYKPRTKIASRGAGKWFKADFSSPDSKGKQLRAILHFLTDKWFRNTPTQDFLTALTSQMVLSRRQGGLYL
jgi:hypothetical protein